MPLAAVEVLERRRLIRAEWRANARWFELTHDRLIAPIERSDQATLLRVVSSLRQAALGALGGALLAILPARFVARAAQDAVPFGSFAYGTTYRGLLSALVFSAAAFGWALASSRSTWRRRATAAFAIGAVAGAAAGLINYAGGGSEAAVEVVRFALMGAVIGRAGIVAPGGWRAAAGAAAGGALAGVIVGSVYFTGSVPAALIVYLPLIGGAWLPKLVRAVVGDPRRAR